MGAIGWAVSNTRWLSLFPGSSVIHLDSAFSDHKPLIIHPEGIPIKKLRPWRFQQVWLKEDACHTTIESAWTPSLFSLSPMLVVESNLMNCQTKLRRWSKESFCNITWAVRDKKKEIEEAEKRAIHGVCVDRVHYLKAELRDLLSREEKLWQQHSKQHWLKEGDQNTSFFHGKASQRFKRNSVKRLRNSNGEWCEGDDQIGGLFTEYFRMLFSSSKPSQVEVVLDTIPQTMTDTMNTGLVKVFTRQEVDIALKQMTPLKDPGRTVCLPSFINTIRGILILGLLTPHDSSIILILLSFQKLKVLKQFLNLGLLLYVTFFINLFPKF